MNVANIEVKCSSPHCYLRLRINRKDWEAHKRLAFRAGGRPGVICPKHVEEALKDEERFAVAAPLGEFLVEMARDKLQWRLTIIAPDNAPV